MIVYKIETMDKIPESCQECKASFCSLPEKKNKPELNKAYLTKRHKNCPLMEIKEAK